MSKNKNKGENELLFITISNKRSLDNVLNKHALGLLTKRTKLRVRLLDFQKDENLYKDYKKLFKKYKTINNLVDKEGLKEFIYKDNNIDPYTFLKLAKDETKLKARSYYKSHKYHHKQPVYKPLPVITTEDLIKENSEIVQHLYTFDDNEIIKALNDFERYKIVQSILSNRGITAKQFKLTDNSYSRIVLLLGSKCSECGSKYRLTLHHIIPKSEGGQHDILNFQLLCRKCHDIKHAIPSKYCQVRLQEAIEIN